VWVRVWTGLRTPPSAVLLRARALGARRWVPQGLLCAARSGRWEGCTLQVLRTASKQRQRPASKHVQSVHLQYPPKAAQGSPPLLSFPSPSLHPPPRSPFSTPWRYRWLTAWRSSGPPARRPAFPKRCKVRAEHRWFTSAGSHPEDDAVSRREQVAGAAGVGAGGRGGGALARKPGRRPSTRALTRSTTMARHHCPCSQHQHQHQQQAIKQCVAPGPSHAPSTTMARHHCPC